MRASFDIDQPARIAECALADCPASLGGVKKSGTALPSDPKIWRELNRDGFAKVDDWELLVPRLNMSALRREANQSVSLGLAVRAYALL